MEDKDFTKCFVFHDMDWVQDILHMSELGLWNMVTDKDMQNVKFYIDGTMARLLGAKDNMSPEACFEFWYKRINRGNHAYVNDVMNRIVHTGKLCEVQYTWNHPEWGGYSGTVCGQVPPASGREDPDNRVSPEYGGPGADEAVVHECELGRGL